MMHAMGRYFDRNPSPSPDLLPPHFRVLMTLSWHPTPVSMSDLAHELGISAGTLTASAKKLVANGYIKRERSRHDDRVVLVRLTSQGKQLVRNDQERIGKVFTSILVKLSPGKQMQFLNGHQVLESLLREVIDQEEKEERERL